MALAHFNYPYDCCGNGDCGKIKSVFYYPNGDKLITIELINGAEDYAVFPKEFPTQPALDQNDHACVAIQHRPRCLFMNGGV